jgi:hypothetical protein
MIVITPRFLRSRSCELKFSYRPIKKPARLRALRVFFTVQGISLSCLLGGPSATTVAVWCGSCRVWLIGRRPHPVAGLRADLVSGHWLVVACPALSGGNQGRAVSTTVEPGVDLIGRGRHGADHIQWPGSVWILARVTGW